VDQIVMAFEDGEMAKEVFHFVWEGKALSRPTP
jgi:hypothetical protein